MSDFNHEELKEMLIQKAEEIEKVPGCREINQDPELPQYKRFKEEFGNIRKSEELREMVKTYSELHKKNKKLCKDCTEDPKTCNHDKNECKKEAKLYYKLYETIIE